MKQNTTIISTAIVAGVILVIALVALFVFKPASSENTVSVQGIASVSAMPDEIAVYFNIETKGETSSEAKDANSEVLEKFVANLGNLGFSREEIVTENYNIYQNYNWDNEKRTEDGFKATHTLKVKVETDDIDKLSLLVDSGVDAGAGVNYINFELSQESQNKYKAEAMKLAAEDARVKAESAASGFGKDVGKLISVSTNNFDYSPWHVYSSSKMDMDGGYGGEMVLEAKEAISNIQVGEREVSASVSAVYKLK